MRYIDLFGGVGGFRLGIEKAFENKRNISDLQQGWKENSRGTSDILDRWDSTSNKTSPIDKWECVWYCDNDKYAVQTYNKNFNENYKPTDIKTVEAGDIPDFDMLCAGFPCQSFSIAGKRRGFEDTRGTMFFEIARIIKAKRPETVFLENVKGLLNHGKGKTFSVIIDTLSELGYETQWMVLNSKFFGVPQNRERVFIIGSIRGEPRPEILPFGEGGEASSQHWKQEKDETARAVVATNYEGHKGSHIMYAQKSDREIARIYDTDGIAPTLHLKTGGWQEPKIAVFDDRNKTISEEMGTLQGHSQSRAGFKIIYKKGTSKKKDIASTISGGAHSGGNHSYMDLIVQPVLTPDRENKRQDGRRMKNNNEPMFTLTGQDVHGVAILSHSPRTNDPNLQGSGPLISDEHSFTIDSTPHNVIDGMKIRRLTPIECERLQGFPDNWTEGVSDTQRYRQMGNAVTVNVIEAIVGKMIGK